MSLCSFSILVFFFFFFGGGAQGTMGRVSTKVKIIILKIFRATLNFRKLKVARNLSTQPQNFQTFEVKCFSIL